MSSSAKTVKSEDNTQDMLIRVMTVARLLTQGVSKKKQQSDAKSNEKKHSNENL
jgi:histone H3/H4